MKNLIDIYEAKSPVKQAIKALIDFNVYGIADVSNPISDALLATGDAKHNEVWLKKTNELRLSIFELEDWIKKNVK